jgi:methionyl-tRNA formyltransferase
LSKLRLGFAGTPDFSASILLSQLDQPALQGLVDWSLVISQPDRKVGRGQGLAPSAVSRIALERGIDLITPESLRGLDAQSQLAIETVKNKKLDLLIVIAFGQLLPAQVLELPKYGCINLHASLLPRWRGAAPIQRALQANDSQTGVCLMQMDEGLDTGPVWSHFSTAIDPLDNVQTLHDRLAELASNLLQTFLVNRSFATSEPQPQSLDGVCYAKKIKTEERHCSFEQTAEQVYGLIRCLDPSPGACATLKGQLLKFGEVSLVERHGQWGRPGEVIALAGPQKGLVVACGSGAVALGWLQRPGGKRLKVHDFQKGFELRLGECFHFEGSMA